MKPHLFALVVLLLFLVTGSAQSSSEDLSRFELGVAFNGLHLSNNNHFGLGGRAVFNLNSNFALEGEGNFFLNNAHPSILSGGRAVQGLFGVKAGLRGDHAGIFAKVRPGFISFGQSIQNITLSPNPPFIVTQTGRLTEPVLDVGTVVEFYPAKHWAWRTDVGDTIIFYRSTTFLGISVPATKQNALQFSTGLNYRF